MNYSEVALRHAVVEAFLLQIFVVDGILCIAHELTLNHLGCLASGLRHVAVLAYVGIGLSNIEAQSALVRTCFNRQFLAHEVKHLLSLLVAFGGTCLVTVGACLIAFKKQCVGET